MDSDKTFSYTYRANDRQEALRIRKRYLPPEENKLEELKRLDNLVQSAGITAALTVGILGCLLFGLGLCLAMEVIGNVRWLGILLGLAGGAAMLMAYPLHRKAHESAKRKHTPRILELAEELTGE